MVARGGSSSAAGAAMAARPIVRGLGATASPITAGVGHGNGGLLHDAVDEMSMSPSPYAAVKREINVEEPTLTRRRSGGTTHLSTNEGR